MSVSVHGFIDESNPTHLYNFLARYKNNPKQLDLEEADFYGNTPLLKACYMGKGEHVRLLIRYGASLTAINYLGQNALTLATYAGSLDVIRLLLRYRSYSDFNKSSIVPALCVATLRQNKKLIEFFRRFSAPEEEVQTAHGVSPAQLSQWVGIYNGSRNGHDEKPSCSGAAYKMR
ncbi:DNA replication inhibitor plutonium [Eurosta solidaginis]|uniref:DNA replication inhibitor plutonium n=1 Tax=Eurosta solidaginis TaxID=178769 RepID=UPI003530D115